MARLFGGDGRAVVVAMDHSSFMNVPLAGLDDVGRTAREVIAGGADAVMVPIGSAMAWADALAGAALILSVPNKPPGLERSIETALAVGADAVKCMCYPWSDDDQAGAVAWLGHECRRWGLPLMVETIPGGFAAGGEMRSPDRIAAGARVGVELGAAMIKTFYPGSPEGMTKVVGNCPVPVVVLGGERAADDQAVVQSVFEAVHAGARGVAIGRNIWQHPNPRGITRAIAGVVHENLSVDQALERM